MNDLKSRDNSDKQFLAAYSRILVVDDDPFFREITAFHLRQNGFSQIEFAVDGGDALEKAQKFTPHLIILDLIMPVMDGVECCRRLRNLSIETRAVPIIVQTGNDDIEQHIHALRVGATDVISKSVGASSLSAKVLHHLEHYFLIQNMFQQQAGSDNDYILAHQVQLILQPSIDDLAEIGRDMGVQVHHFFKPVETIGGDYWGVRKLGKDRIAFYLFDISGHGLRATIDALSLHMTLPVILEFQSSPHDVLKTLNMHLCSTLSEGQYAVGILGIIDVASGILSYAASGMNPAILKERNIVTCLNCSGEPLGVFPDAEYYLHRRKFDYGDALTIYSDALVEPGSGSSPPYSIAALMEAMNTSQYIDGGRFIDAISQTIAKCDADLQDDISVICISRQ